MTPAGRPVVVGSASRDLAARDPRGWRLGGAVTYAGLALARLGLRPRVLIGADAPAASASELDLLRAAGAEVRVVELARSPIFDNREVHGVREQRCLEPGDPLPLDELPGAWRDSGTWVFGPVADELPAGWGSVPPPAAWVALGWQGLLRDLSRDGLVTRRGPGPSPLLARAGLVVVSRLDLPADVDLPGLGPLLRPGAILVVTDGPAGGSVWRADGARTVATRRYPAIPAARVTDPTGAGDAFLAGLVAAQLGHPLAQPARPDAGLRLAAALGSLTVEELGALGVPTTEAVAERLGRTLRPG
ncbi:MAG: PfkB family carbohydrate kinase [Chloroflexota bacterium]